MRMFVAVVSLTTALTGTAQAQEQPAVQRYSIKQDHPDKGSAITHDVVSGSVIPLDKTYAELTPVEQGYLKAQYQQMGPTDEPPFPTHGLRPIFKAVATAHQRLRVEGAMTLFVQVDADGKAISVSVHRSPDPQMTQVVAAIVMLQTYKPGRCDGTPCPMQFPFRFNFRTRP